MSYDSDNAIRAGWVIVIGQLDKANARDCISPGGNSSVNVLRELTFSGGVKVAVVDFSAWPEIGRPRPSRIRALSGSLDGGGIASAIVSGDICFSGCVSYVNEGFIELSHCAKDGIAVVGYKSCWRVEPSNLACTIGEAHEAGGQVCRSYLNLGLSAKIEKHCGHEKC
jgi:hypothetical protein